jgi:hypothetical protein
VHKKLTSGLVAVATTTVLATTATPAQAAEYITVCLSSDSTGSRGMSIDVISTSNPGDHYVRKGDCRRHQYNGNDDIRVIVFYSDARSYKIKPVGGSYGRCHTIKKPNTPFGGQTSNPKNVTKVYYKLRRTGC